MGRNNYLKKPVYEEDFSAHVMSCFEKNKRDKRLLDIIHLYEGAPILQEIIYITTAPPVYSLIYFKKFPEPAEYVMSLKVLERFFEGRLLRIHQSYLVNPQYVVGITSKKSGKNTLWQLQLRFQDRIITVPISRSNIRKAKKQWPEYLR